MNDNQNNYIPSKEDIQKARKVFEEVILTQTLNIEAVREAYKALYNMENQPLLNMKRMIFNYFQNSQIMNNNSTEKVDKRKKEYKNKNK